MTAAALPNLAEPPRRALGSLELWRNRALWLFVASAWFVVVEPAPYELIFGLVLLLFLPRGGLRVTLVALPLVIILLLYNLGGALSLQGGLDDKDSIWFIIISYYLACTGLFFCFLTSADTNARMEIIRSGYVAAGICASVLASTLR